MIGIKTTWKRQEYKIPAEVMLSLTQEIFILQSEYLCIWKIAKSDIEIKLIISDFDKPTAKVIENSQLSHIDPDCAKLMADEEWEQENMLEEFRRLELILKEQGIID